MDGPKVRESKNLTEDGWAKKRIESLHENFPQILEISLH